MTRFHDIDKDTESDGKVIPPKKLGLPNEVTTEETFEDDEEAINWLSDTYGWCVFGTCIDTDEEDTDNKDELREELEEYLDGLRICDRITRKEQEEIMADFDEWCETSEIGDTYCYDSEEYTLMRNDNNQEG